jgi:pimeloyl-ACP methyl ester carboxylesterase
LAALPRSLLLKDIIKKSCFRNPDLATEKYFEELFKPFKIKGSNEAALYIRRNLFKPPGLKPEADLLAKTGTRILLVHGDADPLVPIKDSKILHRLWKRSQLAVFPGAKHNPHEEYADKFNKVVVDFLSGS